MNFQSFSWTQQPKTQSLSTARTFRFRLNSTHLDPNNTISTLHVEHNVDKVWKPFHLDAHTPGFQIFVYSCFVCQHTYLHMNATEQGLNLAFVNGTFQLTTAQNWQVLSVEADFDAYLSANNADIEQRNYVISRMKDCPVSRNLGKDVTKKTRLTIHGLHDRPKVPQPHPLRSLQVYGQQRLTNSTLMSLNSSDL
ncbi:MAG: hypothetical protein AAGA75_17025 [Cyanobacteria bacterium P01_E01_bin.6]